MSHLPRRAKNRFFDARIGSAAANIPVHGRSNIRGIWILDSREKFGRVHDLARLAETTLGNFLNQPGTSKGVLVFLEKPLQGKDARARSLTHTCHTRTDSLSVDENRTGPALSDAAAEFGSGQLQTIA
jgi:hypothetical protein